MGWIMCKRQKMQVGILILICFIVLDITTAYAAKEGDLLAAETLANDLKEWVLKAPNRPTSIAIYSTKFKPGVSSDFPEFLETKILSSIREFGEIKVVQCFECRTVQLELLEDHLVVKKGLADQKAMREMAAKLGVDHFLVLDIYKTKLAVFLQAMLYNAATGEVTESQTFRAPSIDWYESAMLINLNFGPGLPSGGKDYKGKDTEQFGVTGNLMVLEEIGFGKGGIIANYTSHGQKGYLGMLAPALGWRGYFKGSNLYSLRTLAIGFGESNSTKGLAFNFGYDIFIGSFTTVGFAGTGFLGSATNSDAGSQPITSVLSAHIGFNFGF
jgi:hypothetical protein